MAKKTRAKKFEEDFKKSFEHMDNVICDRLQDAQGGYRGVHTVSDYLVYKFPRLVYVELKTVKGNRFYLDRIRPGQWIGLQKNSE